MNGRAPTARMLISIGAATFAIAGCGSSSSSSSASVGDCIDAAKAVVDCSSSDAAQKLVSDQSKPNAIACVQIGSNPQTEVSVDGGKFCAEKVK